MLYLVIMLWIVNNNLQSKMDTIGIVYCKSPTYPRPQMEGI